MSVGLVEGIPMALITGGPITAGGVSFTNPTNMSIILLNYQYAWLLHIKAMTSLSLSPCFTNTHTHAHTHSHTHTHTHTHTRSTPSQKFSGKKKKSSQKTLS